MFTTKENRKRKRSEKRRTRKKKIMMGDGRNLFIFFFFPPDQVIKRDDSSGINGENMKALSSVFENLFKRDKKFPVELGKIDRIKNRIWKKYKIT